jgi:hypothetical protein
MRDSLRDDQTSKDNIGFGVMERGLIDVCDAKIALMKVQRDADPFSGFLETVETDIREDKGEDFLDVLRKDLKTMLESEEWLTPSWRPEEER